MPQANLKIFHVFTIPSMLETGTRQLQKTRSEKLTVVIVKLEENDVHARRSSLCNRGGTLAFCLEYLDGEGNVVMWGDVCEECSKAGEKHVVA